MRRCDTTRGRRVEERWDRIPHEASSVHGSAGYALRATTNRCALAPSRDGSSSSRRASASHCSRRFGSEKFATTSCESHNGPSTGSVLSYRKPLSTTSECSCFGCWKRAVVKFGGWFVGLRC